jgi:predicted AAA+ superfamily ATPase
MALSLESERPCVYLDLESPSDAAKLGDVELYFASHEGKLVVLDEIQRAPELFAPLRGIIDRRRRKGLRSAQFLILGSASLDLLRQSSESLAGRIVFIELTPFHALEVPGDIDTLWLRGGFPESYLAASDSDSLDWRESFLRTYLERDIPMLGPRIPAETLRRFWTMIANEQGQMLNAMKLAAALGISGQTVGRYLDLMVDLLLVRRLPPLESSRLKRLVRSPKVYVRDSGLVHALLSIGEREALLGHPVAGWSWEGFVIENILAATQFRFDAHFYRTSNGAEIDLVLVAGKRRYAIEVKRSLASPEPSKGFHIGCSDIGATHRYVVYPGVERFMLRDKVIATPLRMLLTELAS